MMYFKRACPIVLVLQTLGLTALPAAAAQGGLSAAQLRELRVVPFAVVPAQAPAGFRVAGVHVDTWNHTYTVVYKGSGGATIRIFGSQGGIRGTGQGASAGTSQPRGLFQKIAGAFSHIGRTSNAFHGANAQANASANANPGKAHEAEEEMSSLSADSPLLGPVDFANRRNCLEGRNDRSKAAIKSASFEVDGCNMRTPDALVRAYRNMERVH